MDVTNGTVTLKVSKGAFNMIYKNRGFHPVETEGASNWSDMVGMQEHHEIPHLEDPSQQEAEEEEEYPEEDEEEEVDLSEIPLGEMSFDQLREYADQLELNYEGLRSKKELRVLIRDHLKH